MPSKALLTESVSRNKADNTLLHFFGFEDQIYLSSFTFKFGEFFNAENCIERVSNSFRIAERGTGNTWNKQGLFHDTYSIDLPTDWLIGYAEESHENINFLRTQSSPSPEENTSSIGVEITFVINSILSKNEIMKSVLQHLKKSYKDFEIVSISDEEINGFQSKHLIAKFPIGENIISSEAYFFEKGSELGFMVFDCKEHDSEKLKDTFEHIKNSFTSLDALEKRI